MHGNPNIGNSIGNNAGKGRPKGSLNVATRELVQFWNKFFTSEEYRDSAKRRILAGHAPHLESYLLQRIYGKPPDALRIALATRSSRSSDVEDLTDEQLAERAEIIAVVMRETLRLRALRAKIAAASQIAAGEAEARTLIPFVDYQDASSESVVIKVASHSVAVQDDASHEAASQSEASQSESPGVPEERTP
jgi:hypothetical protein